MPLELALRAFLVAAVDDSADAIAFVVLEGILILAGERYRDVGCARRVGSRDLKFDCMCLQMTSPTKSLHYFRLAPVYS